MYNFTPNNMSIFLFKMYFFVELGGRCSKVFASLLINEQGFDFLVGGLWLCTVTAKLPALLYALISGCHRLN